MGCIASQVKTRYHDAGVNSGIASCRPRHNISASPGGACSYAWRGGEGSVTDSVADSAPPLLHMQARHYDPTLGRFIQADTLMLASFTTQGMNRYIYTENDPVNFSDPVGMKFSGWGMLYFTVMIGVILTTVLMGNPLAFAAAVFLALNAMLIAIFYQIGLRRCIFSPSDINWDDVAFAGMMGAGTGALGGIGIPIVGPGLAPNMGQYLLSTFLNRIAWSATVSGYLGLGGGLLRSWEY